MKAASNDSFQFLPRLDGGEAGSAGASRVPLEAEEPVVPESGDTGCGGSGCPPDKAGEPLGTRLTMKAPATTAIATTKTAIPQLTNRPRLRRAARALRRVVSGLERSLWVLSRDHGSVGDCGYPDGPRYPDGLGVLVGSGYHDGPGRPWGSTWRTPVLFLRLTVPRSSPCTSSAISKYTEPTSVRG